MNKTYLVFRHEFITMMRRIGFIIMTLIVPVLGLLAIVIIQAVSGTAALEVEIKNVGYIDEIGGFDRYTEQGNVKLVSFDSVAAANQALVGDGIEAYFIISQDYVQNGNITLYTLEKQLETPPEVSGGIKRFLSGNLLAGNVPDATISLINSPLGLLNVRLTETGDIAPEQGGYGNLMIPFIFGALLVMSISFSSGYLLAGLGDEKENRLIEVLLSSVSPGQLIVGKVLGLGAAGLIQVIVWIISVPLLLNMASASIGGFLSALEISPGFLVLCIVYFILGYLLFAVISTAVGAITSSTREGQQIATIFTLASVSPLWFSSVIILFPDSPAIVTLSIFPLTSPVTTIMRFGSTEVPAWQIITSVIVLALCIAVGLWVTAKIVRTFLLMYGKRPNMKEIVRSLKAG